MTDIVERLRADVKIARLRARTAELEAALRPFGDAYRYTRKQGDFVRRQFETSMICTKKFTVQDLARAAELVEPSQS